MIKQLAMVKEGRLMGFGLVLAAAVCPLLLGTFSGAVASMAAKVLSLVALFAIVTSLQRAVARVLAPTGGEAESRPKRGSRFTPTGRHETRSGSGRGSE